jgi:hypothetical protein
VARPKKKPLLVIFDPKTATALDRELIVARLKRAATNSALRTRLEGSPPTNPGR